MSKQIKRKSSSIGNGNRNDTDTDDDDEEEENRNSIFDKSRQSSSKIMKLQPSIVESKENICGSVKSIRLKNFMCHSNLEFNFGDAMNIVTGRNGSGKSAVLAGLVIGLGGKASAVNRGRNIRDYVKNGCQMAEISIVLRNKGSDAYQPAKYGDEITVERKIVVNGGGSYKLKSAKGKVIGEKRDDLVRLLDHYNVQLENPVTILTQDASRQFLQTNKPQSLYDFFLRSTQLEQMRDDLVIITQNTSQAKLILENRSTALPSAREEVKQLKTRIHRHESLQGLRDKIEALFKECAWAKVNFQENAVSDYAQQVQQLENELKKFERAKVEQSAKLDELEHERVDLMARKNNFQSRYDENKASFDSVDRGYKTLLELFEIKKRSFEKVKREIEMQGKEKNDLEKMIQEANDADDTEKAKLRNAKMLQRDKLQQQINEKMEIGRAAKAEVDVLIGRKQNLQGEIVDKKSELSGVERRLLPLRNDILSLKGSEKNSLIKFGEQTPQLLRFIDHAVKQTKFKKRPRGPLGSFVTVRDDKWTLAVEVCLGIPLLTAYVCDNFEDSKLLEGLIKTCRPAFRFRPMIIVSKFENEQPYDVQRNIPNCEFPNILSVLDIKDVVVRNVLIDQRGIESIILVEDDKHLRDVMYQNAPAKMGYSLSGNQCLTAPFRCYPSHKENTRFLTASVDETLKRLNLNELQLRASKDKMMSELNLLNEEMCNHESKIKTLNYNLDQIQRNVRQLDGTCRGLSREIDELIAENVDVGVYDRELSVVISNLNKLQEDLQSVKEEKDRLENQVKLKAEERTNMKHVVQRMHIENEEERQNCSQIGSQITKQKEKIGKIDSALREIDEKLTKLRNDAVEARGQLEQLINEAKTLCEERYSTRRSYETVESEIIKSQSRLAVGETDGDIDHLKLKYDEKKRRLDSIERDINQLDEFLKLMAAAVFSRQQGYILMRGSLAAQLRISFLFHLQSKDFTGKLLISHKNKTIEIKVRTHQINDKSSGEEEPESRRSSRVTGRDLKGLSGGERSFSTVCFILSLWHLMDAPFRCLDEFDVFMDMVSRQIAMDMIFNFTERFQAGGQFILLTPMNINALMHQRGEKVSVFELEPPRDNLSKGKRRANGHENEDGQ